MVQNESSKKETVFLDIYKYLFAWNDIHTGTIWEDMLKTAEEILEILQDAVKNNIPIAEDPLFEFVIEDFLPSVPIDPSSFSPAQWKRKKIAEKQEVVRALYHQLRIPQEEEYIQIKNIDDYFKSKKIIQISSIGEYLNTKPLTLKYYENFEEFLRDILQILRKKQPLYKIRWFYKNCEEIVNDVPNILADSSVNSIDFDYLLQLCNLLLKYNDSPTNTDRWKMEYGTARLVKLHRINQFSDEPYKRK